MEGLLTTQGGNLANLKIGIVINMRKFKKTIKIGKMTIPLPLVLVIGAFMASAALVALLFGVYHFEISSTVTIGGAQQEQMAVYYDGTVLTTALDESTISWTDNDPPSLNAGDDIDDVHIFSNQDDTRDYQVQIDTSLLPANGDPADLWYGVDVYIEDDTDTEITVFDLDSMTDFDITYHWVINELFKDAGQGYPFAINYEIREMQWRYLEFTEVGDGSVEVQTTSTSTDDPMRFDDGTDVTLEATANGDYLFTSWTGDITSTDNPVTFTMDADKSVFANFVLDLITSSFGVGAHDNGHWAKIHDYFRVYDSSDNLLGEIVMPSSAADWEINPSGGTITYNADNIEISAITDRVAMRAKLPTSVVAAFEAGNDCYVETIAQVETDGVVSGGIVFNYNSPSDYYLFRILDTTTSAAVCVEHFDGVTWTNIGSDSLANNPGEKTLKLVHNGSNIYDCYIDGSPIAAMQDLSCP